MSRLKRRTGGKIEGTKTGDTYEKADGKFFRGTEKQVGIIRDEVKEILVGKWSPDFRSTRQEVRKCIWQLVQRGVIDESEFTPGQLNAMRDGHAPYAPRSQRTGEEKVDKKYHLHHRQGIAKGGGVHDLDNMIAASPLAHGQIFLTNEEHYGEHHGRKKDMELEAKENKRREQISMGRISEQTCKLIIEAALYGTGFIEKKKHR